MEMQRLITRSQSGYLTTVARANASNGQFSNSDGSFNWGAFMKIVAADQIKKEGKDLVFRNEIRDLQNEIALDSDEESVEFQEAQNQLDRSDVFQSFLRTLPTLAEAIPAQYDKIFTDASPLMSDSQFDLYNGLRHSQHRAPITDMLMQNMAQIIVKKTAITQDEANEAAGEFEARVNQIKASFEDAKKDAEARAEKLKSQAQEQAKKIANDVSQKLANICWGLFAALAAGLVAAAAGGTLAAATTRK